MRRAWLVVALLGCGHEDTAPATAGSAVVARPTPPACDIAGSYRFRFRSNGADGWWLPVAIEGGKATVPAHVGMLGLDERTPISTAIDGCTVTLAATTDTAGTVGLTFTVDPKTNTASGELTRTKGRADLGSPASQRVSGRRDVGGLGGPACLKPGVFHIAATGAWKLASGRPRFGNNCKDMAESVAQAFVRIQPYGDELVVDEAVHSRDHGQSFERGVVKRLGDCEIALTLKLQDFDFTGTLTLAGDTLTGSASEAHYQFMEDGEAGENLWACKAAHATLTGERVAD